MSDHDQIDPTRDRVWVVDVIADYRDYVVAETADEAERVAREQPQDLEPDYLARQLTQPLHPADIDADSVPAGRSCWDGREITVNEAVDLLMPAYDGQTLLMPFAEGPPPLYPRSIEDYLAAGGPAR